MMLFSTHIVDTGPLIALRRRTPKPRSVPGLRSARVGLCGPFSPGALPRPQLGREILLAQWDDESALDRFLADHPTGRAVASGWGVRMELFRGVGVWPGVEGGTGSPESRVDAPTGPTIAITIGTFYVRRLARFLRANAAIEEQFLATPNAPWGTGFANVPQRTIGTFTIWKSASAAEEFMRAGAHGAAVREHFDPAVDPTGHTFVTGGGFFGFRPISASGSLSGKNPLSIEL